MVGMALNGVLEEAALHNVHSLAPGLHLWANWEKAWCPVADTIKVYRNFKGGIWKYIIGIAAVTSYKTPVIIIVCIDPADQKPQGACLIAGKLIPEWTAGRNTNSTTLTGYIGSAAISHLVFMKNSRTANRVKPYQASFPVNWLLGLPCRL